MPLSNTYLSELILERYFLAYNRRDADMINATLARDCIKHFSASDRRFEGLAAMKIHNQEFFDTFQTIYFHNIENVIDVDACAVASRFDVHLTDNENVIHRMQNCNFFKINPAGLFGDILIYNSAPIDQGFRAGSA